MFPGMCLTVPCQSLIPDAFFVGPNILGLSHNEHTTCRCWIQPISPITSASPEISISFHRGSPRRLGGNPQRPQNADQIGLGSQPLGLDNATTFPSLFFASPVGRPAVVAPIASSSGFVAVSTLPVLDDAVEPCCETNEEQARQPGSWLFAFRIA